MKIVHVVLLALAFICFALETFEIRVARKNLLALGLALWIAASALDELAG